MKKLALILVTAAICVAANAQIKISTGDPYIDLKYKRTIVSGNTVMIDFVMTNLGRTEIDVCMYSPATLSFTDDEGNIYGSQHFKVDIGNSGRRTGVFTPEIPLKVRFILTDIDEYATSITSIIYPYYYYTLPDKRTKDCTMKIYNIPIPRN